MNRVLTVYFTRTENSRKIAEEISIKLKSDIDEIVDKNKWKGVIGFINGGFSSVFEKTTKVACKKNPADYDVVIIVSPVWASKVPPAVRTYVTENIDKFNNYALIVNNDGGNIKKALDNFNKILPDSLVEYGTSKNDIDTESCQKCFEDFADAIRRTLEKEKTNA